MVTQIIYLLAGFVGWFVVAAVLVLVFGWITETIQERSKTTLEDGDFIMWCPECGWDQGTNLGTNKKCGNCNRSLD